MILINAKNLESAIRNARLESKNLRVTRTNAARQYRVENRSNGNAYIVDFFICSRSGNRYGQCNCKAGVNQMPCKHLAAAAAFNSYLAANGLLNIKAVSIA